MTLIDLEGTKGLAPSGGGSKLMRKLHDLVVREAGGLPNVAHAYVFNDSVLLLSYVGKRGVGYQAAMQDADKLKRAVDETKNSYAVAVKGQPFPPPVTDVPRVIYVEASSWAMANCFFIEAKNKKHDAWKKPWCVDGRIRHQIQTLQTPTKRKFAFWPNQERRDIYLFEDYLWD